MRSWFLPLVVGTSIVAADIPQAEDNAQLPLGDADQQSPDEAPATTVPAEARLSIQGSGVEDVVGWSVGLRYRERAIVKMRRNDTEFPEQPQFPPPVFMEHPSTATPTGSDLFSDGGLAFGRNSSRMSEYNEAMDKYREAVRNPDLFLVDGAERIVFDTKLELPFDAAEWKGKGWIDIIHPFVVKVPNTNFPPQASVGMSGISDPDDTIANTESSFEYYIIVNVADGTTFSLPAGKAGFLPAPAPIAPHEMPPALADTVQETATWPKTARLRNIRYGRGLWHGHDPGYRHGLEGSEKVKEVAEPVNFEVALVRASDKPILQGETLNLTVTVKRNGTGTMYPRYMRLRPEYNEDNLWLRSHSSSEEEYENTGGHVVHHDVQMRMVPNQAELEERRNGPRNPWGGPWGMRGSDRLAEFDFEASDLGARDEYEFQIEVPMWYRDMPSFVQTFTSISHSLEIFLLVKNVTDKDAPHDVGTGYSDWGHDTPLETPAEIKARDNEWKPFELPRSTGLPRDYDLMTTYAATVKFDVTSASPAPEDEPDHYLNPDALGPALALSVADQVTFPPLGSVRVEEGDELRRTRYFDYLRAGECNGHQLAARLRGPPPGYLHAATLWQAKERAGE